MLAQQQSEKVWQLDSARTVTPGSRYMFLIVAPQSLSQDQALALLMQQGWDGPISNSAPSLSKVPDFYAPVVNAITAEFARQNLPAPHLSNVHATWKGQAITLPTRTGDLIYGPMYLEVEVPPTPNENSSAPSTSLLPATLAFIGGIIVFGGAWWYIRKHPFAAGQPASATESSGTEPVATYGKLRWISSEEEPGSYEIIWWSSRLYYFPISSFGGKRQEAFTISRTVFNALRYLYDTDAFEQFDQARMIVQNAVNVARSEWKNHESAVRMGGAEAAAVYEWAVIHRLNVEAA